MILRFMLLLVVAASCGSVGEMTPDAGPDSSDCVLDTSTLDNCTL